MFSHCSAVRVIHIEDVLENAGTETRVLVVSEGHLSV